MKKTEIPLSLSNKISDLETVLLDRKKYNKTVSVSQKNPLLPLQDARFLSLEDIILNNDVPQLIALLEYLGYTGNILEISKQEERLSRAELKKSPLPPLLGTKKSEEKQLTYLSNENVSLLLNKTIMTGDSKHLNGCKDQLPPKVFLSFSKLLAFKNYWEQRWAHFSSEDSTPWVPLEQSSPSELEDMFIPNEAIEYKNSTFIAQHVRLATHNNEKIIIKENEWGGKVEKRKHEALIMVLFKQENAYITPLKNIILDKECNFGLTFKTFSLGLEYMPEGSLFDLIPSKQKLSLKTILQILLDIARGLEILHRYGVIHRDIKPSNILLFKKSGELRAKVADFGLATYLNEKREMAQGGTFGYMPPEAISGEFRLLRSFPWDIYSFGKIIQDFMPEQTSTEEASVEGYNELLEPVKHIQYCCIQEQPKDRPPASQVAEVLNQLHERATKICKEKERVSLESKKNTLSSLPTIKKSENSGVTLFRSSPKLDSKSKLSRSPSQPILKNPVETVDIGLPRRRALSCSQLDKLNHPVKCNFFPTHQTCLDSSAQSSLASLPAPILKEVFSSNTL